MNASAAANAMAFCTHVTDVISDAALQIIGVIKPSELTASFRCVTNNYFSYSKHSEVRSWHFTDMKQMELVHSI
jgi:hypothetical protein